MFTADLVHSCRKLLLLCGFFFCALSLFAQSEDWLPVTQRDLRMKEVPGMPGAAAVQLYYADYIDDQEQTEFFYHRIKILNDKGNRYADVEILVPPDGSISELKARTIHPDGKIIEFAAKPFQKVILKQHGVKVVARAFTFPEVTVGSIVEYKYKIDLPGVFLDNSWTIQHELYTVKEKLRMTPYGGNLEGFERGHKVAALSSHMPGNLKPKEKDDRYELDVDNMPPFEPEGFMPPEDDYKPQIRFFYGGTEMASAEKFWQGAGRQWNEEAERFIGRHSEIAEEAAKTIADETDPIKKLRRLYARAQQVRNLTYERDRTQREEQRENLKPNQNVIDVLVRGYGARDDVGRFFVALARAAGFEASILRVSDRQDRFFDRGLLSRRQLDSEIALVLENGQSLFLDPGTRFCPFGFVRWTHTSTPALKLDKDGGAFIKVPAAAYNDAMVRRSAEMVLDATGPLKGTITARFESGEALERRLNTLGADEAGRKEALEEEARDWLPREAVVRLVNADGWEATDAPLIATFAVELPSYAVVAGKRLLVPTYLFQSQQLDVFKHAERKFPVYFPYAFGEADTIAIKIPEGYAVETLPPQQTGGLDYATYLDETHLDGRKLVTQRVLQVNGIFFRVESYPEVKEFFSKVRVGDEQRTVFRADDSPAAHGTPGERLNR